MRLTSLALLITASASPLFAQSGGFVTTLGSDTVQMETFRRDGNEWAGTIVQRTPTFRTIRWSMTTDAAGRPMKYVVGATDKDGAPLLNGIGGTLTYAGDSIFRDAYAQGQAAPTRMGAPAATFPGPTLPYLGVSYLVYEMAINRARADSAQAISLVTMASMQRAPGRTRVFFVGPDSAELDYFGVAKSGYRFDAGGRLIRADWRGTTYRYRTERVASLDLDRAASLWAAEEKSGKAFGALSPRDSAIGAIGTSRVTIDYSRPAKRGRNVWGDVVPMDRVWRLGADMATHFTTSEALDIGGTRVPAGRYTLWMIASKTAPMLVVSSAVNVFGTNYDPAKDFARIPLQRSASGSSVERLTLSFAADKLEIAWDDAVWSVPIKAASAPTSPIAR